MFGQVHVNDSLVRVTGEILSTETDTVVGTLKATGPMNDLFSLEDALGDQARRAMGRLESPQTVANAQQPGQVQQPPMIQATGPIQIVPYPQDNATPYATYDTAPVYPVAPYSPYDSFYPDAYYPYYPGFIYGGIGIGRNYCAPSFGRGDRGFRGGISGGFRGGLGGGIGSIGGGFRGGLGGGVRGGIGGGIRGGAAGHAGGRR